MRKITKILLFVLMISMLTVVFSTVASAQDTATTFTQMYIGEYEGENANIVFGEVSNKNDKYGILIKEKSTGNVYSFEGKYIGDQGKFGIALYNIPEGDYVAQVYSGDTINGVFGAEIPFTANKSEYLVTFYDENDEVVKTQKVMHGASATSPEKEPFKVSSWFAGYDTDFSCVHTDLEVRPIFETSEEVSGLKLYKDSDKEFKILNLADIQIINTDTTLGAQQGSVYPHYIDRNTCVYDTIKKLVSENNPDWIVLNGDNIYSRFDFDDLRTHRELMSLLDSFEIPWSIVVGNHDGDTQDCNLPETDVQLLDVLDVYKESKYFVFDNSGSETGDYFVSLVDKQSGELLNKFFFMYTHTGYLNDTQIEWYEKEVQKLILKDRVIPSVLWMHIPLPELEDALILKYGDYADISGSEFNQLKIPENANGDCGEINSAGYSNQYGLFDLMKRYGSTQLAIFGHNHSNNASVEYKGIRLSYALKTGLYDQSVEYLNGGTVLTIKSNNTGYSLINDFVSGTTEDYGGEYNFDFSVPTIDENVAKLKLSNGQAAAVSGSKKITLSAGESASIEFDMVTPLCLTGLHTESNYQFGFRVSSIPITQTWVGSSTLLHFSKAGSHGTSTFVDGVIPNAWGIDEGNVNTVHKNAIEEVFRAGNTYKFEIYSDATFAMYLKDSDEDATKYVKFAYGSVDSSLIANGFYLGIHTNREFQFKNMKITGSTYLVDYTFALCSFELNVERNTFNYNDNSKDVYPGFISNGTPIAIPNGGSISFEMTVISAPANITASTMAAFVVTDDAHTLWMYATTDSFRVHLHHGNIGGASGGGKSWTGEKVENSSFDVNATWTGGYVLVPYKRYKFELKSNGEYSLSVKFALDNSEYETFYKGTVSELDMTKEYYIGFLTHNNFEFSDLAINGVKVELNTLYLKNGTIS